MSFSVMDSNTPQFSGGVLYTSSTSIYNSFSSVNSTFKFNKASTGGAFFMYNYNEFKVYDECTFSHNYVSAYTYYTVIDSNNLAINSVGVQYAFTCLQLYYAIQ